MSQIKRRLEEVRNRITQSARSVDRDPRTVRLLAVSKRHQLDNILQAYAAGQRDFGENYCQELMEKVHQSRAKPDICWHFIGPIQSNKTRDLAENAQWVHTLERRKIADRLSAQRPKNLAPLNVCIQINIDDEETKAGASLSDAHELAEYVNALPNLRLRGLMAIPKKTSAANSHSFSRLNAIFCEIQEKYQWPHWDTLSMGMSDDLEAAISHGATIVRVGTDIFGPRSESSL